MSRPRRRSVAVLAIACALLNVSARQRAVGVRPPPDAPLSLERSFAVTDPAVLAPFRFERVMNALAGPDTSGEALFRQWWDTQNAPHCHELVNGFARRCPTAEGALATQPYRPDDFKPLAAVNRFDMADPSGAHCGQYRLIYAVRTQWEEETFHVIFEGALPNPRPERGLEACRPVAQFWADLTNVDDLAERRVRLERFFFDGLDGFAPVVHPDHYGHAPAGIRTIQRTGMPSLPASFFQFRLKDGVMHPDVLENQPSPAFFDDHDTSDRARRFRDVFVQNVASLATPDVNLYFMNIPAEFLVADTSYVEARPTPGREFADRIDGELRRIGSTLTAADIVRRAETRTCVGCHSGEGMPGLQHVADRVRYEDETAYVISDAMRFVFIPHRMQILRDFLREGKAPVHSN